MFILKELNAAECEGLASSRSKCNGKRSTHLHDCPCASSRGRKSGVNFAGAIAGVLYCSIIDMASHSSLESRLRERDESRKAAIEQRRVEREAGQRHEETADYYAQEYARKKAAIVELLESAGSLPKDQLTAHFNRVSAELQSLKKFVSDSSVFLPAFDLKSSQQVRNKVIYKVC